MDSEKIEALQKIPYPDKPSVKRIQEFLGMAGYYRRFIFRFAEIARPLTYLTRKGVPWKFGEERKRHGIGLSMLC